VYIPENHYDTVNKCGETSYTWPRNGQTYTQSGDYTYEHHEAHDNVCEHTDHLHLTIGEPTVTETSLIHCGPYEWGGVVYDTSGYYTRVFQGQNGCDSIVIMRLDIKDGMEVVYLYDTVSIDSFPFDWHGHEITEPGLHSDTVHFNDDRCDSVYHIIFYVRCDYQVDVTYQVTQALCSNNDAKIEVTGVLKDGAPNPHAPFIFGYVSSGVPAFVDTNMTGTHVYDSLASPRMHVIVVRDKNDCFVSKQIMILPRPQPVLVCPPTIVDTLEYGEHYVTVDPERLSHPEIINWDETRLQYFDDVPQNYQFVEGDNVVTWEVVDTVCGNKTWTCEQHVVVVFPDCPDAVDCEGNIYHGIRIDDDCWTQRNLISHRYQNADASCGDTIPCIYEYNSTMFPNTQENVDTFGRLYCFEGAVKDSTINENGHIQGICPSGWYLPTPEQYLALNAHGASALKSPLHWIDGGGDNSTTFTWLPAGFYNGAQQRYEGLLTDGYFWSVRIVNGEVTSVPIYIRYDCDEVKELETFEGLGYSIRCIKER
jgi:uncharacterized protein (TIGR02145 family)